MTVVTDFRRVNEGGRDVPCDAFGNNVAFVCPECGHPMLAIMRDYQRGSSLNNPAVCRGCGLRAWLSADKLSGVLRLKRSDSI